MQSLAECQINFVLFAMSYFILLISIRKVTIFLLGNVVLNSLAYLLLGY